MKVSLLSKYRNFYLILQKQTDLSKRRDEVSHQLFANHDGKEIQMAASTNNFGSPIA